MVASQSLFVHPTPDFLNSLALARPSNANDKLLHLERDVWEYRKTFLGNALWQQIRYIVRLERELNSHRKGLFAFSNFFKIERLKMHDNLARWCEIDPQAIALFEYNQYNTHQRFEKMLCDRMVQLARQFPRHQFRRSESMEAAIDNAFDAIETGVEDVEILREEIANVDAELEHQFEMQQKLRQKLFELTGIP